MGLAGQSVGELQANKRPASEEVNALHTHHTCTHTTRAHTCIHIDTFTGTNQQQQKACMVGHSCNPRTWEPEIGGS